MLKEDIRVGDLLRTDIDLPSGGADHFNEERLVLVVSTDTSEWRTSKGYVVVLDSGVRTEISCVWLWPGARSRRQRNHTRRYRFGLRRRQFHAG